MILVILKRNGIGDPKGSFYVNCISPTETEKAISCCINSIAALPRTLQIPRRAHLQVSSHLQHIHCSPAISSLLRQGSFPAPKNTKITRICQHEPPRLNKHLSAGNTVSNYSGNQHKAPALSLSLSGHVSPPQFFHHYSAPTPFWNLLFSGQISFFTHSGQYLEVLIISDCKNLY